MNFLESNDINTQTDPVYPVTTPRKLSIILSKQAKHDMEMVYF